MARKANLTAIISAVDKVSGPMKRIQRSLRAPVRAFTGLGQSVANLGGHIAGILGPLGALGGALSVAGLVKTVNDFARGADEVSKFSRQIGFTAEAYQELTFAADRQGVSQSTLNSSMIAFTKRLGELKAGTGGLYTLLQKVNPELAKQLVAADSTESAFNIMVDSLSRLQGEENKAALAAAAFSRSGVAMVRVAENGTDGLDALRAEARRLGIVIDNETAAKAEGFVDSLTNMQAAMTGVRNIVGGELLPALQPLIDEFTKFILANKELIRSTAADAIKSMTESLKEMDLKEVIDGIKAFKDGVSSVVDFLGGWDNAAIGLVALMNGPLIAAVASVGSSIVKLGVTLATNPIGAIILGIAWAASLIYRNWDSVEAWFKKMWGAITKIFGGAYDVIAGILTGDMERVVQGLYDIWDGFKTYWSGLWEGIRGSFKAVWDDVIGIIKKFPFSDKVFEFASKHFGGGTDPIDSQSNLASKEQRAAVLQNPMASVNGQMNVTVQAPNGYRVVTESSGDFEMNADVGHRRLSAVGSM